MKAELLNQIPLSGSVEEKHFDAISNCTWVMFEDRDYCNWAGVFGYGWGGGTEVCLNESGLAFVLSNGQGFLIDVQSRNLLHKTECDYLKSVVALTNGDTFVASDDLHLYLYENGNLTHTTERIALDGIEFKCAGFGEVVGKLWGLNEWHEFEFSVRKRELKSSWIYDLG